jgi:hypothetical protein
MLSRLQLPGAGPRRSPLLLPALLLALLWFGCAPAVPSRIYVVPPAGAPALDNASINQALAVIDRIAQQHGFEKIKTPPELKQIADHYATMVELARYNRTDQQVEAVVIVGLEKRGGALQVSLRDLRGGVNPKALRTLSDQLQAALRTAVPQGKVEVRY